MTINLRERYTRKNVLFLRWRESATFPRMFSSPADEVFKISFIRSLGPSPRRKQPGRLMQRIMGPWPMGWLMESKKGEQYNVSLLPLGLSKPKNILPVQARSPPSPADEVFK